MAWQTSTINPAVTTPAADISKITNDLQQLRSVIGGGSDADIPVAPVAQRIGINTPALTANNPSTRLAVAGDVTLVGGARSYVFNAYYSATNARWEYASAGETAAGWVQTTAGRYVFISTGSTTGAAGSNAPMAERMSVESNGSIGFTGEVQAKTNLFVGGNALGRQYFRTATNTTIAEIGPGSVTGDGNKLGITTVSPGTNIVIGTNTTSRIEITDATTLVYHNLLLTSQTGTLGYGTGAGGSVTQSTSKSTAVTLNRPCGRITMNNAALAAGASVAFTLINSLISPTDLVICVANLNTAYRVESFIDPFNGATIRVTNTTAGSLSDALQLNFAVIKGVAA